MDEYLTEAAAERLGIADLYPKVYACDATGELPGTYDRIISTVAVRPVPASWLAALRPGGRLVTTLAGTSLIFTAIRDSDAEQITEGDFPVVNVNEAWELYSTIGVTFPGVRHRYEQSLDGTRTAWMLHPDGSWARATAKGDAIPVIHQADPRRLWDILDDMGSSIIFLIVSGVSPGRQIRQCGHPTDAT